MTNRFYSLRAAFCAGLLFSTSPGIANTASLSELSEQPQFERSEREQPHSNTPAVLERTLQARGISLKSQPHFPDAPPPGPEVTPRIIGGQPTPAGDRRYQVSLQDPENGHFCGGALIDSQWVLTAAHCVQASFEVFLNSTQLWGDGGFWLPVSQVIVHPEFNPATLNHDLALVRLAQPAPESLEPLALATPEIMATAGQPGDMARVSGWGAINNESVYPDYLQQVDVPLVTNTLCQESYVDVYGPGSVTEQMLCAGYADGGKDSCFGDSGGPLTVTVAETDYSVGVVSWGGQQCALPGFYGVYARTAPHLSWIEQAMKTPLPEVAQLESGAPITGLAGAIGETLRFQFVVSEPAGYLSLALSGGTGDADLRIHYGEFPSSVNEACVSAASSNEERCTFTDAPAGIYTVVVEGFTRFEGVTLQGDYILKALSSPQTANGLYLPEGVAVSFSLDLSETVSNLTFGLEAEQGDPDLYVRRDEPATEKENDCASALAAGERERCVLETAEPGRYHVRVSAYEAILNGKLTVSDEPFVPEQPPALCEHKISAQIGRVFIASVTVHNQSEAPLSDWAVTWQYDKATDIYLADGLLSGRHPYRWRDLGSPLAPDERRELRFIGRADSWSLENPTVHGEICR